MSLPCFQLAESLCHPFSSRTEVLHELQLIKQEQLEESY